MQSNNHIKPIQHGVLCKKDKVNAIRIASPVETIPKRRDFFNVLYKLSKLIDVSVCDQLVDTQLKEDARVFKIVNLTHKMNFILRKDTPKSDLERFHRGGLFFPVTSALSESLKNNHLITWPGLSEKLMSKHLALGLGKAK